MNMELINKARSEITEQSLILNNSFATFIEEYLNKICTTEKVAKKILNPDKTLKEFCDKCVKEAREIARKKGNGMQYAGFPDAEYYERVERYYNISPEDKGKVSTNIIDITSLL